jgi:FkbM family methyltransferase
MMNILSRWFQKKEISSVTSDLSDWLDNLGSGSIAIDCGANVGKITVALAKTGATVYAFEPNPHAFVVLKEATAIFPNVVCLQKAVGADAGHVKLYMHQNAAENPVYWSTGSSLLESKGNVNANDYVDVECVDLCAFIQSLGQRVNLLKMDVEGIECSILRKMIETGLVHDVDRLYCEMHDKKIESLRQPSNEIRELVRVQNLTHVDLNWI